MSYEAADGLWDWLIPVAVPTAPALQELASQSAHAACTLKAEDAQLALDERADRIRNAWPSERTTFRVDLMANTLAETKRILATAEAALVRQISAKYEVLALNQQLASVRARIAGAQKFADGVAAARRQGIKQISSGDFRLWVVRSGYEAGSAYYAVALVGCHQAWIKELFGPLIAFSEAVLGAVVAMVSAAIDIAGAILDLPDDIASLASTLLTVVTVAAAGYVGYRVYDHVKKRKKGGGGA